MNFFLRMPIWWSFLILSFVLAPPAFAASDRTDIPECSSQLMASASGLEFQAYLALKNRYGLRPRKVSAELKQQVIQFLKEDGRLSVAATDQLESAHPELRELRAKMPPAPPVMNLTPLDRAHNPFPLKKPPLIHVDR